MEEISKTHSDAGMPGEMFIGAANIYRMVEATPLGKEVVEDRKLGTALSEVAAILANHCRQSDQAAD